jgi:hypothetical protein
LFINSIQVDGNWSLLPFAGPKWHFPTLLAATPVQAAILMAYKAARNWGQISAPQALRWLARSGFDRAQMAERGFSEAVQPVN